MKTKRAWAAAAALALGTVAFTAPASAQKPEQRSKGDVEYRFKDDLLDGDRLGAAAPRIHVLKTGRRDRLLRPRLHFVPEMLKSVEKM